MTDLRLDLMLDDELKDYARWAVGEIKKHRDMYDDGAMHLKDLLVDIAVELYSRRENSE